MLGVEVSQIHRYPLKPPGFEEPLFPTAASKRLIIEHLLESPWLSRASELEGRNEGAAAHALEEPIGLDEFQGRVYIVQLGGGRRRRYCSSCKRQRVDRVLGRWRQVSGWWAADRHVDRLVFRVLLSSGSVVDLAREPSGGWFLLGVVD